MTDLVEYLNKAAAALYLAVDQVVADELSPRLNEAATALEAQTKEIEALKETVAHLNWGIESLRAEAADWDEQYVELEARAEAAVRQAKQADACCDSYVNENQKLHDRMEAAERERDEARAALKAFTSIPLAHTNDIDDSATVFEYDGGAITLGDLRRAARAVIEKE